ncbi:hypothetical protein [Ralstonia phage RP31]|uniref:Uncharacterized protein n=2 Tax=Ripduovirus RP12 TaxID=2560700 RepID=A0A1L7N117_9CAUD|nr:hypothetical protein FDH28_gp229 [Ralstonia phage RP12]BAW19166.1 hypothetical protein [Ralstonia phage RP12]BAW19452.1 hypothetical protein [Ralstonia phage RP31]
MKLKHFFAAIATAFISFAVFASNLSVYSEDSPFPLVKQLAPAFDKATGHTTKLRETESVTGLANYLKQGYKPDLFFTEDTWLLSRFKDVRAQQIAIDPIVLVYLKDPGFTKDNWMQKLSKLNYGFSNPNADPLGYYAHFIFGLYNQAHGTKFQAVSKYDRNETTDLFNLMKAGNLDVIFTYKSFAVGSKQKFFELPAPYGLDNPNYDYSQVSYTLKNGEKVPGHVSSFGVGIMNNRPETAAFVKFLADPKNIQSFKSLGLIQ